MSRSSSPSAASPDVSWEAYTLSVSPPGRPYVLEVEYPSDVPQTLGLSIIETNAAGTLVPIGLDSGIDVSRRGRGRRARRTGSGIGWSSGRGPLRRCCLITNRRQRSPAVYGKIRVLGGWERLPRSDAANGIRPASPDTSLVRDRLRG